MNTKPVPGGTPDSSLGIQPPLVLGHWLLAIGYWTSDIPSDSAFLRPSPNRESATRSNPIRPSRHSALCNLQFAFSKRISFCPYGLRSQEAQFGFLSALGLRLSVLYLGPSLVLVHWTLDIRPSFGSRFSVFGLPPGFGMVLTIWRRTRRVRGSGCHEDDSVRLHRECVP